MDTPFLLGPFQSAHAKFMHHQIWPNIGGLWSTHIATLVLPSFWKSNLQSSFLTNTNTGVTFTEQRFDLRKDAFAFRSAFPGRCHPLWQNKVEHVNVLKDRAHFDETPAPMWHFPSSPNGRWRASLEPGIVQAMSSAVIKLLRRLL